MMEVKKKYGEYYYRNLCNTQGSPAEKQVQLTGFGTGFYVP